MIIKVYKCLLVVEDDIKKKYAVNIDSNLYVPPHLRDPAELKFNRGYENYMSSYISKHRRKWNKRLRNMGYRYI
jgi:hypothetical protein